MRYCRVLWTCYRLLTEEILLINVGVDCSLVITGVQVGLVKCLIDVNSRKTQFRSRGLFPSSDRTGRKSLRNGLPNDYMDMSTLCAAVIQENTVNLHRHEYICCSERLSELHSVVLDLNMR